MSTGRFLVLLAFAMLCASCIPSSHDGTREHGQPGGRIEVKSGASTLDAGIQVSDDIIDPGELIHLSMVIARDEHDSIAYISWYCTGEGKFWKTGDLTADVIFHKPGKYMIYASVSVKSSWSTRVTTTVEQEITVQYYTLTAIFVILLGSFIMAVEFMHVLAKHVPARRRRPNQDRVKKTSVVRGTTRREGTATVVKARAEPPRPVQLVSPSFTALEEAEHFEWLKMAYCRLSWSFPRSAAEKKAYLQGKRSAPSPVNEVPGKKMPAVTRESVQDFIQAMSVAGERELHFMRIRKALGITTPDESRLLVRFLKELAAAGILASKGSMYKVLPVACRG